MNFSDLRIYGCDNFGINKNLFVIKDLCVLDIISFYCFVLYIRYLKIYYEMDKNLNENEGLRKMCREVLFFWFFFINDRIFVYDKEVFLMLFTVLKRKKNKNGLEKSRVEW